MEQTGVEAAKTSVRVVCTPGGSGAEAAALAEKLGVAVEALSALPAGHGEQGAQHRREEQGAQRHHEKQDTQRHEKQGARRSEDDGRSPQLVVRFDAEGVALVRDGMELQPDFPDMVPRLRQGALQRELLVRAARVKGVAAPTAVDATAGLGADALLLAAAGFAVTLCEHDAVIAALLRDALRRAVADPALADSVARMRLVEGDSVELLAHLPEPPDVVYLDPMFPERRKSAAVKKRFQLLHLLERPCAERAQEEMLAAALAAHPRKVVVKRPAKGPHLAGAKPSYSVAGKAVRYDVIVPSRG